MFGVMNQKKIKKKCSPPTIPRVPHSASEAQVCASNKGPRPGWVLFFINRYAYHAAAGLALCKMAVNGKKQKRRETTVLDKNSFLVESPPRM